MFQKKFTNRAIKTVDRMVRKVGRFGLAEKAWNTIRYPALGLGQGVNLQVDGEFRYGNGCSIGDGTNIAIPKESVLVLGNDCYFGRYVDIGPRRQITIGTGTSIQDRCILLGDVTVGRHCLFAPNIMISSGNHHFDLDPTWLIRDQDRRVSMDATLSNLRSAPIVVEDDCWLGINSVIMRGVTVAKGTVVGAGAIVVKNSDPYTVVAGVPAKEIRRRLSFIPPKRINSQCQSHWPYFYSGFDMSQQSISEYSIHGGIAAREEFVLSLDASAGKALHLVVKCMDAGGCDLAVSHKHERIEGEFREAIFDCEIESSANARIVVQVLPSAATAIVKEAWMA